MPAPASSAAPRFVVYLRVGTDEQGRSGFGLEAQREAVLRHAAATGGRIIGEHVEVEGGRKKDGPQLAAALAASKARGVRLGNPHLLARCPVLSAWARDAQQVEARRRIAAVLPYLEQARVAGATTLLQLADALMKRGVPAPRGGERWHPAQVRRVLAAAQGALRSG